jgi:CxxC motif-containing protein (DUF1111 family)
LELRSSRERVKESLIRKLICFGHALLLIANPVFASEYLSGNFAKHFSKLRDGLTAKELAKIKAGYSLYGKSWVTAPASTVLRDGLGPHFNSVSCLSCHPANGRGRPLHQGRTHPSLVIKVSTGNQQKFGPIPVPGYGTQIQTNSILGVPTEAKPIVQYYEVKGQYSDKSPYKLYKPIYHLTGLGFGPLTKDFLFSPRLAPIVAGVGLLNQISEQQILELADPHDKNRDGIKGTAQWLWVDKKKLLGRFGHKAGTASLRQQVAQAFHLDMGITSSIFPKENCGGNNKKCLQAPSGGSPEISDQHLSFVELMVSAIDRPLVSKKNVNSKSIRRGQKVFKKLNCHSCHRESFIVNGQEVRPYTDLLLHDMGENLADNRPEFMASGRQWKTAPLWGIGSHLKVHGGYFLLHDGRARSIEEAILWHDGEARASKLQFKALSVQEREQLVAFIETL